MQHPTEVAGMAPEKLAVEFAKTRYDFQATFFGVLAEQYATESEKDQLAHRPQLSGLLSAAVAPVHACQMLMQRVWHLCKQHMNE